MATMTVLKDDKVVMEVTLEPHVGIGRHPRMKVQLEDPLLSRTHAEVTGEGKEFFLRDTGSSNGTFLNGRKLEPGVPAKIAEGDVGQVGPFELKFRLDAGRLESTMALPSPEAEAAADAPPPPSILLEHLIEGMAKKSIPVWSTGETMLRVADIVDETDDVKTFRLVGREPILFSYKPGQFVTLHLEIDGKKVLRSYSLSSAPSRPHTLEITVKRVPGGLVSNWLADNVKLGDLIKVRGPSGKFTCFEYPARKILLIGGGSGITPVMSMCRWIVDTTADVDVRFFVSAKSPRDIIFRKELELMSARHSGLQVMVTSTAMGSGTEAWVGITGRCSEKMFEMVCPDLHERHIFMCGPEPFMVAVKEILRALNFPLANLHTESFGGARGGRKRGQAARRSGEAPVGKDLTGGGSRRPRAGGPRRRGRPRRARRPRRQAGRPRGRGRLRSLLLDLEKERHHRRPVADPRSGGGERDRDRLRLPRRIVRDVQGAVQVGEGRDGGRQRPVPRREEGGLDSHVRGGAALERGAGYLEARGRFRTSGRRSSASARRSGPSAPRRDPSAPT
ncbi:MAG: FHA domain-containing protein [Acidobacteria bacterium]|nr:FHA domain-containing protein [Acidobacteriota bacterium]